MEEFEEQTNEVSDALADARDDLAEELRIKLIESGWRDQVASLCRQVIEQQGAHRVKMLDIVRAVRSEAKSMVPASIRAEMLARIRALKAVNDENDVKLVHQELSLIKREDPLIKQENPPIKQENSPIKQENPLI